MPVEVIIKEYLTSLEKAQQGKPIAQQRPVPGLTDFAKAAKTSRQTIHGFINRKRHKQLNLDLLSSVISVLRGYGYNTQLTDVLVYKED